MYQVPLTYQVPPEYEQKPNWHTTRSKCTVPNYKQTLILAHPEPRSRLSLRPTTFYFVYKKKNLNTKRSQSKQHSSSCDWNSYTGARGSFCSARSQGHRMASATISSEWLWISLRSEREIIFFLWCVHLRKEEGDTRDSKTKTWSSKWIAVAMAIWVCFFLSALSRCRVNSENHVGNIFQLPCDIRQ